MKSIPKDYVPPKGEGKQFEDGVYEVKGFEWFTLDSANRPMLVAQAGQLVGRLRFTLKDGESGPPMSVGVSEMPLLVMAFGREVKEVGTVPDESVAGNVSSFMEKVASLCNNSGKSTKVEVSGSWVQRLLDADIKGFLDFRLVDFFPREGGVPAPRMNKKGSGQWFGARFEVLAKDLQKTPLEGATFSEFLGYGSEIGDDGKPDWTRTDTGAMNRNAYRMSVMMQMTAPSWVGSWDGSDNYSFQDPKNLLPEWLAAALAEDKRLRGHRGIPEGGDSVELLWATVEQVSDGSARAPVSTSGPPQRDTDAENKKAREGLIKVFRILSNGEPFEDESSMKLTDVGKSVAKAYLTPLKEAGKLPAKLLNALTFDEIQVILENIKVPDEKKSEIDGIRHQLSAIGIGVDAADF